MSVIVIKKGPEANQRHLVTCPSCKSELSYADADTVMPPSRPGDDASVRFIECPICHRNIALGSRPR